MANPSIIAGIGVGTVAAGAGITVIGYGRNTKPQKIILNSSSEIISYYKKMSCVNDLFETIVWSATPNNNDTKGKIENSSISLKNEEAHGCVSVWWKKETYESENWRGSWNLLWGTRDEKYGTIFVSTVMADKGKIQVDKSFYLLEKQQEKWTTIGKWTKNKENVTSSNKSDAIVPSVNFPTQLNNFSFSPDKVCSENKTCNKSPNITLENLNWKYMRETATENGQSTEQWDKKISKWIKDKKIFEVDIENIYKNTNGYYKLEWPT